MPKENSQKIYFIVGPTASGKTALSIELAKKLGSCEVISCDSRQIFRDFDLATGKVTKEEMDGVPHHMLDIVDPGQEFSVVDFTNMALEKIEDIFSRDKTPIVCGGTGFYVDNLIYDYKLPSVAKNDILRKELEPKTTKELYLILKDLDRKYAKEMINKQEQNNKVRLIRAIEIATTLGCVPKLKKIDRFSNVEFIFTNIPREELRAKIHARILARLEQGMLEEIKSVQQKYNLSYDYLEKLGLEFKWAAKYFRKQITEEQFVENLFIETCQYARRQDTWFRRYKNYK